jgi:Na+/H+ antiporter NhaC
MNIFLISKKYLLLIAGFFWILAGLMVMKTGYPFFANSTYKLILTAGAIIVFLVFYLFIFSKLVAKHEKRIREKQNEKLPFWQFFNLSSYIIIIVMISGGITIRKLELVPQWFIAFFYTGLGFALFSCGTRFVARFIKYDNKKNYKN